MEIAAQIIGFIFASFIMRLAYKFFKKEKYPTCTMLVTIAAFIMLCSFPWFQGWAKAYFASNISSKLEALGQQVNTVQQITTEMQNRLANHQRELEEAQTNLNAQEIKLSDVEYWIKNIYEKVTDEDFSGDDTNHVLIGKINDQQVYFLRLSHIPITNSVEAFVKSKPFDIEQRLFVYRWGVNIWEAPMNGFTASNTSLSIHYITDTRATNYFKTMADFQSHISVTSNGIYLIHPK